MPALRCGADRLGEYKHLFKDARVGLVTTPTGRTSDGRSTIAALQQAADLRVLLGPEHGVRGDGAAGAFIPQYTDAATGLPVFSLYGKDSKRLTPAMLDNDLAYNEDLLANWQAFCAAPGCAFCDWPGYHYRQHADSASRRGLPPQSLDDQRRAAALIRGSVPGQWPVLQQSANAFYYEKLVYLASMILRRADIEPYRVQLGELRIGITAGLNDRQLGRNPQLPFAIKVSAWATVHAPKLWRKVCRKYLKDRQ